MSVSRNEWDRPYLRVLAGVFAVICGISLIRYAVMGLMGSGVVPLLPTLFCLLLAAGGVLYFAWPRVGHHLLLGTAVMVLIANGASGNAAANVFWLLTILVLSAPAVPGRYHPRWRSRSWDHS